MKSSGVQKALPNFGAHAASFSIRRRSRTRTSRRWNCGRKRSAVLQNVEMDDEVPASQSPGPVPSRCACNKSNQKHSKIQTCQLTESSPRTCSPASTSTSTTSCSAVASVGASGAPQRPEDTRPVSLISLRKHALPSAVSDGSKVARTGGTCTQECGR